MDKKSSGDGAPNFQISVPCRGQTFPASYTLTRNYCNNNSRRASFHSSRFWIDFVTSLAVNFGGPDLKELSGTFKHCLFKFSSYKMGVSMNS